MTSLPSARAPMLRAASTDTARAPLARKGAPSATPASSRGRNGSRRSCGRSGSGQLALTLEDADGLRAGGGGSARARRPGRRSPAYDGQIRNAPEVPRATRRARPRRRSPPDMANGATPRGPRLVRDGPGSARAPLRAAAVHQPRAVQACRRRHRQAFAPWRVRREMIPRAMGGARPTPLAMISAAVAETCGAASKFLRSPTASRSAAARTR